MQDMAIYIYIYMCVCVLPSGLNAFNEISFGEAWGRCISIIWWVGIRCAPRFSLGDLEFGTSFCLIVRSWENGYSDSGWRRSIFGGECWLPSMGLRERVGLPINLGALMVVAFGSISRWVGMPFLFTLVLMLVWGIVFYSGMTIGVLSAI
jgi:hypothetical protein